MINLLLLCVAFVCLVRADLVVQTTNGQVQGYYYDAFPTNVWQGIPYAAPPVGNMRWQDPVPPANWQGIKQTTQFGPGCYQACKLFRPEDSCPPVMSEDCLNLNVYAPLNASNLPVMFWIHGGNYIQGAGSTRGYHGSLFAYENNVVVVTINYRLGVLGALYVSGSFTGNFQTKDQRLAMKWVQANIKGFGGNPNLVTIFGQSAGGYSVATHLASPPSWGLFHRAIVQSDPFSLIAQDNVTGNDLAGLFMKQANCTYNDVQCLLNLSPEDVIAAQVKTNFAPLPWQFLSLFMPWVPVLDAVELPLQPLDAAVQGKTANVPVMIGTVANETLLFIWEALQKPVTALEYEIFIPAIFGYNDAVKINDVYGLPSGADKNDTRHFLSLLSTDYIMTCPTRKAARAYAAMNNTYMYFYDHYDSFTAWLYGALFPECIGYICHAAEVAVLWNTQYQIPDPKPSFTPDEVLLSAQLQTMWTNFAISGNPNQPVPIQNANGMSFEPIQPNTGSVLQIINGTITMLEGRRVEYCDLWDQIGYDRR